MCGEFYLETMPPKRAKTAQKPAVICPICENRILDASGDITGEDSIECEGLCKTWLHRKCTPVVDALLFNKMRSVL